ncbi:MAG: hypothetical protein ACK55K_07935 [Bacteroidota bacterium]
MASTPDYIDLLPEDFHPASRVWIYQSNRLLFMSEALQLEEMLNHFISQWKSHGNEVKGFGTLFFGQFIILMADETAAGVSGCSTDSSVHFIQEVEKTFGIQLLNRQLMAFWHKDKVQSIPLSQVAYAIEHGLIDSDTLYFNNLADTKHKLIHEWLVPVKDSWLKRYLPANAAL